MQKDLRCHRKPGMYLSGIPAHVVQRGKHRDNVLLPHDQPCTLLMTQECKDIEISNDMHTLPMVCRLYQ